MRIDSYYGYINDNDDNSCYPYANGERVSAWKVVSVVSGENSWDPKTITLTGYAPPMRTPVTEINSNTTLTQNIEGYVTITGNVTLDLAGYTITGGGYHSTVIINNGSTLTLTDSSSGKTGTITGGGGEKGGGVLVKGSATFKMQGGNIKNNKAINGGGVAVEDGATFSMTGGIISNNKANGRDGGGVMIYSGSFTMSGDSIIQNNSAESDGGDVYAYNGSFSLQNGTISNNSSFNGGGVGIGSSVTFNMTGGAIKENTAKAGGGVYNSGGNFNMSNGLIDANRANWEGGGVYQQSYGGSVFTMTGGSITNNIGGSKGYAGVCIGSQGSFNLSGGAVIDGNKHGGTEEDICLYPGNVIKVTGTLTAENTMSVRLTNNDGNDSLTGTIAQGSGYTLTEADGAKFVASTSNRKAVYDSENQKEQLVAAYAVTYNGNGNTDGVVPVDSDSPYLNGSTVTVLGNTGSLAKTNNVFDGWNTAANGSGTSYEPNATFDITGNITLYSQWEYMHTHSWSYAIGTGEKANTITATCDGDGDCEYKTNGITLTIVAPTLTTYGGTGDATATLDGLDAFNTATSKTIAATDIKYIGRDGTTYAENTTAPTDAGKYTAKIIVEEKTASVNYEIAKVNPTAPTDLTATYGQTLADVTLPDGWTWADSTQSVGSVVSPAATFKANFAGNDNYNAASNVDVTVTVNKAANPATVTNTATVTRGGNTIDLASSVTLNGATGEVTYAIDGEANDCTLAGSVLTSGTSTGTVKVNVTVATDNNYEALTATPITVTINEKNTQTITANDVTVTYGDTNKKVTASVSNPTTGGGAISYAVKNGSEE